MSRRTQLTTKFIFQITAQLSENFIFIYLGLTLFTETDLEFKPLFILIATVGICAARWLAVFPLSKAINAVIRLRARRRGQMEIADELPYNYQAMLYWAGLRGAVGVALAAGLSGENGPALRATVLVVVVLTVIIFGGTTARMLEILGIRTGVVEEIDSDDEFDIEIANGGTYYKRSGNAFGHTPRNPGGAIGLEHVNSHERSNNIKGANGSARPGRLGGESRGYSSSNRHSPPIRAGSDTPLGGVGQRKNSRGGSSISQRQREEEIERGTLLGGAEFTDDEDEGLDLDLPPSAPRHASPFPSSGRAETGQIPSAIDDEHDGDMGSTSAAVGSGGGMSGMAGGIRDLFRSAAKNAAQVGEGAEWFKALDENVIKPTLLLDQHQGQSHGHGHGRRGASMGGGGGEDGFGGSGSPLR